MILDQDNILAALGVASGVLAAFGYNGWKKLRQIHSEEKYLQNQRVYSPDEIHNIIQRNDPLIHTLFKRSADGNQLIGKNLLIQGYLSNNSCLDSQITQGKQLVARKNCTFPYYYDKDLYSILSEKRLQSQSYSNRFYEKLNVDTKIQPTITLSNNGVSCVAITDKEFKAIDKECFDHSDSKMVKYHPSILKHTWNKLGLVLASVVSFFGRVDARKFLCFQVKVDNCEIGIRNEGILSILGNLEYDLRNGKMTIPHPLRLMKNKIESLQDLRDKAEKYLDHTTLCWIFSAASAISSIFLLYKSLQNKDYIMVCGFRVNVSMRIVNAMRWIKSFIQHRKLNLPLFDQNPLQKSSNLKQLESVYINPREDMECIICYSKCRSVIIRPCQHCSMCQSCYSSLSKRQCPLCTKAILGQVIFATDKEQMQQQVIQNPLNQQPDVNAGQQSGNNNHPQLLQNQQNSSLSNRHRNNNNNNFRVRHHRQHPQQLSSQLLEQELGQQIQAAQPQQQQIQQARRQQNQHRRSSSQRKPSQSQ